VATKNDVDLGIVFFVSVYAKVYWCVEIIQYASFFGGGELMVFCG
jgi:hypothetical protein